MSPVFETTSYDLEKVGDFVHGSGSGADPTWRGVAIQRIVNALEGLASKVRGQGHNPEESALPRALYAARELQKYIARNQSDISGQKCADVFTHYLRHEIRELREFEREFER